MRCSQALTRQAVGYGPAARAMWRWALGPAFGRTPGLVQSPLYGRAGASVPVGAKFVLIGQVFCGVKSFTGVEAAQISTPKMARTIHVWIVLPIL